MINEILDGADILQDLAIGDNHIRTSAFLGKEYAHIDSKKL